MSSKDGGRFSVVMDKKHKTVFVPLGMLLKCSIPLTILLVEFGAFADIVIDSIINSH